VDGRTDRQLRPTLLGQLRGVDLKNPGYTVHATVNIFNMVV